MILDTGGKLIGQGWKQSWSKLRKMQVDRFVVV